MIGDCGVGKSSIILRFHRNMYKDDSQTTLGVEFSQRILILNNNQHTKV